MEGLACIGMCVHEECQTLQARVQFGLSLHVATWIREERLSIPAGTPVPC